MGPSIFAWGSVGDDVSWAIDHWERDPNATLGDAIVLGLIIGLVLGRLVRVLFREAEKVVGPGHFWWWAQVVTAVALLAGGGMALRELLGLQSTMCTVTERKLGLADDGHYEVLVRVRWDLAGNRYTTREPTPVASVVADDRNVYPVGSTFECVTTTRVPPEVWGTTLWRRQGELAVVLAALLSAFAFLLADGLRRRREAQSVPKPWGWNELGNLAALVLLCTGAVAYRFGSTAWGIAIAVLGIVVLVAVTIRETR